MIHSEDKIMVTVKEFASLSGLGEFCVRRLANVKGFPALKNGRKIMIHRRAADEWLAVQSANFHSADRLPKSAAVSILS